LMLFKTMVTQRWQGQKLHQKHLYSLL